MPKLQYFFFIIKRFIRLTLPMLCTIAFIIILPLFGDGPHWEVIKHDAKTVEKYWWMFIFHIHNFYFLPYRIFGHLWFLAVLMQLTVLTLFLLIIKDRWPRIERKLREIDIKMLLLSILISAGIISQILIMLIQKHYAMYGISLDMTKVGDYFMLNYTKPYSSHLSSYCLGLLIGDILISGRVLKFRKNIRLCFWVISVVLLGLMVFGLYDYRNEAEPNETIVLIHAMLSPIAWTAVIAWVTIACITGHGGILNKFFSLDIFIVLERF